VIRAFAAVALPEAVRFELMLTQQGLPLPRPVPAENLLLTLVFLGELPGPVLADVDLAFGAVRAAGFDLRLSGVGLFGGAKPRAVYAGIAASPALAHLQAKLERAARGAGVEVPARRYVPHVTLAWLPDRFEGRARLERAVAARGGVGGPAFAVEDFRLYRSRLTGGGAVYEELVRYPLAGGAGRVGLEAERAGGG
jgi:2'-5' RNA ligase